MGSSISRRRISGMQFSRSTSTREVSDRKPRKVPRIKRREWGFEEYWGHRTGKKKSMRLSKSKPKAKEDTPAEEKPKPGTFAAAAAEGRQRRDRVMKSTAQRSNALMWRNLETYGSGMADGLVLSPTAKSVTAARVLMSSLPPSLALAVDCRCALNVGRLLLPPGTRQPSTSSVITP